MSTDHPSASAIRLYLAELGYTEERRQGRTYHALGEVLVEVPHNDRSPQNWRATHEALETLARSNGTHWTTVARQISERAASRGGVDGQRLDVLLSTAMAVLRSGSIYKKPLPSPTCERAASWQQCNGRHHLGAEPGKPDRTTECPLYPLREALQKHAEVLQQYEPKMRARGWDPHGSPSMWGMHLLASVERTDRANMPALVRHAAEVAKRPASEAGHLLIVGKPGIGKSMVAFGMFLAWLAVPEAPAAWIRWEEVVELAQGLQSRNPADTIRAKEKIESYRKHRLIVFDDLAVGAWGYGITTPGDAPTAKVLSAIADGNTRTLFVMTANLTKSELERTPEVGPRAMSRLLAQRSVPASVFELDGPDARVGQVREHAAG